MFYKKDCIKMLPLGLNDTGRNERNACVIKMSGLPLYCFTRNLSPVASKLNAKMVHVPRLPNGLPGSTAYFYFNSKKDKNQALALKELSYQGRQVFLTTLDKKSCFACGSAEHEVKSCKSRFLRYPLPRSPHLVRNQPKLFSSSSSSPSG